MQLVLTANGRNAASLDAHAHEPKRNWLAKDTRILNREGNIAGTLTGAQSACQLEGCTGVRVSVVWDDKKHSRPCSKGLRILPDGQLQIS